MKEQSHLDEMRAAVRGDLERSRARREPAAVDPQPEPEPELEPERPGFLAFLRRDPPR